MTDAQYRVVMLTRAEFNMQLVEFGEYSCTLPTGTTIGKKWFRNNDAFGANSAIARAEEKMADVFPDWWQGEYVECTPPDPARVGIRWRKVVLADADGGARAVVDDHP